MLCLLLLFFLLPGVFLFNNLVYVPECEDCSFVFFAGLFVVFVVFVAVLLFA